MQFKPPYEPPLYIRPVRLSTINEPKHSISFASPRQRLTTMTKRFFDTMFPVEPLTQIDQFAPFAAEGEKRRLGLRSLDNRLTAGRAPDLQLLPWLATSIAARTHEAAPNIPISGQAL